MRNEVQLITYVDRFGGQTLTELQELLAGPLQGAFGGVHLLPFFYKIDGADAGFDPIDHTRVDDRLGDWNDIQKLSHHIAVMADVIDIARGTRLPTFGVPAHLLRDAVPALSATPAPYYLRMTLLDKPGALAKIATCLGEAGVSIDQMRQYGHEGANAPVLIVTHKASRDDIDHAIGRFAATGVLVGAPVALRIEEV